MDLSASFIIFYYLTYCLLEPIFLLLKVIVIMYDEKKFAS